MTATSTLRPAPREAVRLPHDLWRSTSRVSGPAAGRVKPGPVDHRSVVIPDIRHDLCAARLSLRVAQNVLTKLEC